MPVYNTRDLIPFVNELERRIERLDEGLESWNSSSGMILSRISEVPGIDTKSTTALVKAEEALAEIGTATYDVTAARGQRLKTLIDQLRAEMVEIAKNTEGAGGYDPRINAEINNAISQIDGVIPDGLKLDYRLREIMRVATEGGSLSNKELIVPHSYTLQEVKEKTVQLPEIEGVRFVDGEVTVLDEFLNPILHPTGELIHGSITEDGKVTFNYMPTGLVKLYFPVQMAMKEIPANVLHDLVNMMVTKSSTLLKDLLLLKEMQDQILQDIQAMKGERWTVDFSIMRNHREIVEEQITPKGLHTEIVDGMATLTFAYNDHPNLSHFELEKWDEEKQTFVPFDGEQGVIFK